MFDRMGLQIKRLHLACQELHDFLCNLKDVEYSNFFPFYFFKNKQTHNERDEDMKKTFVSKTEYTYVLKWEEI